jgi:adenine deaminase
VIEALEGQLITNEIHHESLLENGKIVSDVKNDILKMAVVNRYQNTKPAVAFIKNFGLKKGAIASSVAHDCHNIVVVGTSDEEICNAVNLIIKNTGGICAVNGAENKSLALPVAGIISDKNGWETGKLYEEIDAMAKTLGSNLRAPFMTLSFMALLVIPDLKLSDKGLFSGNSFSFVDLEVI